MNKTREMEPNKQSRLMPKVDASYLYNVEDPGENDVLFGRGTGSNMHSGNIRFRALIQEYKPVYRDRPKNLKPSVSTEVVALWRNQNPPGRFLSRCDRYHGAKRTYYDVGDAAARRKAAQCLREKSSEERAKEATKKDKDVEESGKMEEEPLDATGSDSKKEELTEATKIKEISVAELVESSISDSGLLSECSSICDDDEATKIIAVANEGINVAAPADSIRVLLEQKPGATLPEVKLGFPTPNFVESQNLSLSTAAASSLMSSLEAFGGGKQKGKDSFKSSLVVGSNPRQDWLSLSGVLGSQQQQPQEQENAPAEKPSFLFGDMDLGHNDMLGEDNLMFPSLNSSTAKANSANLLDGIASVNFPSQASPLANYFLNKNNGTDTSEIDTSWLSDNNSANERQVCTNNNQKNNDALHRIGASIPTAASLTTNLFD